MTKTQTIAAIDQYMKKNGLQEINGQIMNVILKSMTQLIPEDSLITSSYGGLINPGSTLSVTPGVGKWFIAEPGTYNNLVAKPNHFNVLSYDGSNWIIQSIELPSITAIDGFESSSKNNAGSANNDKRLYEALTNLRLHHLLSMIRLLIIKVQLTSHHTLTMERQLKLNLILMILQPEQ